jgi:hypothetical protein
MGGQQGITSDLRPHLAIAQDEMGEDREHRFACRALYPPDGDSTQPDPGIMGVARETPTAATRSLVCELKAQGEEKGHHTFDKGLAISQELKVGRFVLKINGNGAIVPCPFARLFHMSPLW